ncbi:MAG: type I methionyl aminopeptidase [Tissierellia bacterium]|nr:type I methionyl aminopeptidase [Tissierellia bacterium]
MISIKSQTMIDGMKRAGRLLRSIHEELQKRVKPGVTTLELDAFVESYLRQHGGLPAQKGYMGFPYATCASVNDEVCHGFPTNIPLKEGDILTIDMVISLDGYLADSAWSYALGNISEEAKELMEVTEEALLRGIAVANNGAHFGDIGVEIENFVRTHGFSVVRDFVGHGIGRKIHEDPQVLHYNAGIRGPKIRKGMVFTIEPMINVGDWKVKLDSNGWTARTRDGSLSCQYEHTMAMTDNGIWVLTDEGFNEETA